MDKFLTNVVTATEAVLTWRARRRWTRKQKQKQKNVVLDWIEAFVWSACVVLLVNQYAFQAYEIPSPSMERTLLVHDRIFVNKFQYGPELLPGMFKLPGAVTPQRGDVIIFESPEYLKNAAGPVFDIAQRLIYMLTLSLVDIDRDEQGKPKAHFLVKRGVGYSGDVVRWRDGEPQFQLPGTGGWTTEADLKKAQGLTYETQRMQPEQLAQYYALLPAASRASAAQTANQQASSADLKAETTLQNNSYVGDRFEGKRQYDKAVLAWHPESFNEFSEYFQLETGTWVPDGYVLPLGDNRDNSRDGRYWGPVPLDKILGEASFRYWPLGRAGGL